METCKQICHDWTQIDPHVKINMEEEISVHLQLMT